MRESEAAVAARSPPERMKDLMSSLVPLRTIGIQHGLQSPSRKTSPPHNDNRPFLGATPFCNYADTRIELIFGLEISLVELEGFGGKA